MQPSRTSVKRIRLLARRVVQSLLGGEYHSIFKGSGISFDEVREYQPGDDIRQIDWNVTARMRAPFVKQFLEERELTVILVADLSASQLFGTQQHTKREVLAELAGLVAFSALANRDRVGLLAFSGGVDLYLPAQHGSTHAMRILQELLNRPVGQPGTAIGAACEYLQEVLHRRSIIFFLSDWQATGYEAAFRLLAHQHEIIAVRITDPRELELPNVGLLSVIDPETQQHRLIDTRQELVRAEFIRATRANRQAFEQLARGTRTDVLDVDTQGHHVDELIRFFRRRLTRKRGR